MSHIEHKKTISRSVSGFTLIETLVAIAILSVVLAAAFTAVAASLQGSTISKDRITAFFLAQEAADYIRNIRDENALLNLNGSSFNWLHGLADTGDPCAAAGSLCYIDSQAKTGLGTVNSFIQCPSGVCPFLKQDQTTFLFNYSSGNTTYFKRWVQIQQNSATESLITITVTWTTRGVTNTFQVPMLLFNRQ